MKHTSGPTRAARDTAVAENGSSLSPIIQRIALASNSSLDAYEVLERLAELTLEAIPGDRCSIFVLDDAGRLVPKMASGRIPNEEEFRRFLGSAPIELDEVAERLKALTAGRAFYIPDMASSPLVPDEFVERFNTRSALVVPLIAHNEPVGILSVDWILPGHDCTEDEVALVEAIGAYVALALRNATLFEGLSSKALTLERLVNLAGALNSAASLRSVLELVCSSFEDLLGTKWVSVDLLDSNVPESIRTVATRGEEPHVHPRSNNHVTPPGSIADDINRIVTHQNRSSQPLVYPNLESGSVAKPPRGPAALFPLSRPDGPLGYVIAAFRSTEPPDAESLTTGQALAELAAAATSRAHLHQELQWRLQRAEIVHRLSDVVAGAAELSSTLRKLNELLPDELGTRLESISLANIQLRDAIGAPSPTDEELEAIRSWRAIVARRANPMPRKTQGGLLVPIAHRRRVLGVLKVAIDAATYSPPDEELLLAIASGCAEIVYKAGLQRELEDSERRLTIVAERERIARDLHDSVGQLLTGLGMRILEYETDATDPVWRERLEGLREIATKGSREMRAAIQSLLFLQVRREGLARSLRELARRFEATTGMATVLRVSGDTISLATVAEDALFRVAHEALMNAERHSRASSIVLSLSYTTDDAVLAVTDDGIGLGDIDPFSKLQNGHFGLQALRGLLGEVGGDLQLSNLLPHGLRIEGRIPVRGRGRRPRQ
jgi:signal transduction histidine kinase